MNGKSLSDALGYVDDVFLDIVESEARAAKRKKLFMRYGAAAACLALIFMAAFLLKNVRVDVALYGQTLSSRPEPVTALSSPALYEIDPARARQIEEPEKLEIPLEIKTTGKTSIRAADGKITVTQPESGEILYEGGEYTANGEIALVWSIDDAQKNEVYELRLSKSEVLALKYDNSTENWTIYKK